MPSNNKTPTERPRPATGSRPIRTAPKPAAETPRSSGSGRPPGKDRAPRSGRNNFWKNLWENIGWGLVIGLPIILVVLAILWRATNGFQGTPENPPLPTPVPTATAGAFVAPPAVSGNKDRLLYLQAPDISSPMQLFSSNPDGSNPTQLTNTREIKGGAVWSPDGKQIAFTADNVGIQVINFDGTGLHTVAYNGFNPVWSPDGKQIAFLKNSPAPDGQGPDRTGTLRVLFVTKVEAKPGDEKQLVGDALGHNWSPDGKQIAFFSLRNAVMFTVEVETAKTEQIKVPNQIGGWYPTFAPDGNSLVFYGNPNPTAMVNALDLAIASASVAQVETGLPSPTPPPANPTVAAPALTPGATTTGGAANGTPAPAGSPTVAASPTPTVIPGPTSQMSLYQINRDGSGLKKLQDLEPTGGAGGGKYRFMYYIATSADLVSTLTARPYFKIGPVFAADGKNVAALYVAKDDKIGLAVVRTDGSPASLVVEGENGLEPGTRLNPYFGADNARLLYSFVPPKAANPTKATPNASVTTILPKQARYFDLSAKAEKTLFGTNDTTYVTCCGFVRK